MEERYDEIRDVYCIRYRSRHLTALFLPPTPFPHLSISPRFYSLSPRLAVTLLSFSYFLLTVLPLFFHLSLFILSSPHHLTHHCQTLNYLKQYQIILDFFCYFWIMVCYYFVIILSLFCYYFTIFLLSLCSYFVVILSSFCCYFVIILLLSR